VWSGAHVPVKSVSLGRLGRFDMFIRRAAALHLAVEGAIDSDIATWSAWLGLVALSTSWLAGVTILCERAWSIG